MEANDDALQKDHCIIDSWQLSHSSVFFDEKGSILLGLGRLLSFFCILLLHQYNRYLLRAKSLDNVNIIPGLVLPYYFTLIYLYIGLSLLAGLVDLLISSALLDYRESIYNFVIPFEQAVFHWFYEGIAVFLMRYGAGVKAIQSALSYSFLWSLITFIVFFCIFSTLKGTNSFQLNPAAGYTLFVMYAGVLFLFYTAARILPKRILYRRSALKFYALFNMCYYGASMVFSSVAYYKYRNAVCPASVLSFFYIAFIQPYILFKTLQIDSQYWQGLKPGKDNPLAEVWDHVDMETAQSMAEQIEHVQAHTVPILHYALLDFDNNHYYIAGGFSRVYFGFVKKKRVAFKVLFAMELTPTDVVDFYNEAALLHSLQHVNIVACKGICVMPPALTIVLEFCEHGSLYDFLYKPVQEQRELVEEDSVNAETRSSLHEEKESSLRASFAPLSVDRSSRRVLPKQGVEPASSLEMPSAMPLGHSMPRKSATEPDNVVGEEERISLGGSNTRKVTASASSNASMVMRRTIEVTSYIASSFIGSECIHYIYIHTWYPAHHIPYVYSWYFHCAFHRHLVLSSHPQP
jgi:hypothetical protein